MDRCRYGCDAPDDSLHDCWWDHAHEAERIRCEDEFGETVALQLELTQVLDASTASDQAKQDALHACMGALHP